MAANNDDHWTELNLLSFSFKRTSYKINISLFPLACCYHIEEKNEHSKQLWIGCEEERSKGANRVQSDQCGQGTHCLRLIELW